MTSPRNLDAEEKRAAEENMTQDEYALFQMLFKDTITKADRERLKQASRGLLDCAQSPPAAHAQLDEEQPDAGRREDVHSR